ncbi:hypothetical protein [Psychrobacillus sp.]|uniref:hypothetical protein n=1 Tax=Psychrobacillus sp. TaxID=1871623 RepID=UPI0028BE456B|nr:hypothetical protein [Psychrobacillus sp.]
MFNSNNKMKMSDELIEIYEPYRLVKLGPRSINPNDIIGFSLTRQEILDSSKLQILQESMMRKVGSRYIYELILLPNGKFTVGNGGNHRAYLSKKLKLSSVSAHIDILIAERDISKSTIFQIEQLEQVTLEINKQIKILTKYLNLEGVKRNLLQDESLTSLHSKADFNDWTINQLLIIEVKNLGYLPNSLFERNF